MNKPLNIALAGLGTVGVGVIQLLRENEALITKRAGRPINIVSVSARDRNKDRGVDLSAYRWVDDMSEMAQSDDVDIVVELVGGSDGPALALARSSLSAGKSFVTANKAMVAHHGFELAQLGEQTQCTMKYEAAVAGGIPVIKGLRDGAASNRINRVYGILNGTCNYILSTMESEGSDFSDVLSAAQTKGYAEADPSFDIDGVDAAHKLAILASLCFGTELNFDAVETNGIRKLIAADISQAATLGYNIRLLGLAEVDHEDGALGLFQRVQPYLVKRDHPLAHVTGPTNAVVAEGNFSGRLLFQGAGAGDKPTASAVVADIIDIARGETTPIFGMPVEKLRPSILAQSGNRIGKSYIRMMVADRPGVLAEITAAMRDSNVSIESLIQQDAAENSALIAMVTHAGPESAINATLETLSGSDSLLADPMVMHILGD